MAEELDEAQLWTLARHGRATVASQRAGHRSRQQVGTHRVDCARPESHLRDTRGCRSGMKCVRSGSPKGWSSSLFATAARLSGERATVAPKGWLQLIPELLGRRRYPPRSAS